MEPLVSRAAAAGCRKIADLRWRGGIVAGDDVDEETAAKLRRALNRAVEWLRENEDRSRDELLRDLTPEQRKAGMLPELTGVQSYQAGRVQREGRLDDGPRLPRRRRRTTTTWSATSRVMRRPCFNGRRAAFGGALAAAQPTPRNRSAELRERRHAANSGADASSISRRSAIRRRRRGRTSSCIRPKARPARRVRSRRRRRKIRRKRGVTLWVETDGTIYWSTPETAITTHGDGANRNDNKYIDNSKTYPPGRSRTIRSASNSSEIIRTCAKPATPEQVAAWLDPGAVPAGALWHSGENIYAHNWIDYKDHRYCEGCELAERRTRQSRQPKRRGFSRIQNASATIAPQTRSTGAAFPTQFSGTPLRAALLRRSLLAAGSGRRAVARRPRRQRAPMPLHRPVTVNRSRLRPSCMDWSIRPPSPGPSACDAAALPTLAAFTPLPTLIGPARCGAVDVVQLEAVTMPDKTRVSINPPAMLRCAMAEAVAHLGAPGRRPAATELGAPLAAIANFDSYDCRGRNRIAGAKLSEHGKGNALDIRAIRLAQRHACELTDPLVSKPFRERMRTAACAASPPCSGRARTAITRATSTSTSSSARAAIACASGMCASRRCRRRPLHSGHGANVPLPQPRPTAQIEADEKQ